MLAGNWIFILNSYKITMRFVHHMVRLNVNWIKNIIDKEWKTFAHQNHGLTR